MPQSHAAPIVAQRSIVLLIAAAAIGPCTSANAQLERLIVREVIATPPAGVPADARRFHLFAEFGSDELAVIRAHSGEEPNPSFTINNVQHPGAMFFQQSPLGGDFPPSSVLFQFFPDVEFDTYVGIGNQIDETQVFSSSDAEILFTATGLLGGWLDIGPGDRQGEGALNPVSGKYETFLGQFTLTGLAPESLTPDINGELNPDDIFAGALILGLEHIDGAESDYIFKSPGAAPEFIEDIGPKPTFDTAFRKFILREFTDPYPAGMPEGARTFRLFAQFDDPDARVTTARGYRLRPIDIDLTAHPGAHFFQADQGADTPPDTATIAMFPLVEFDTYVGIGRPIDDPDAVTNSFLEFTDTRLQGSWWDQNHTDEQGEGTLNPESELYETFLGQFTIIGLMEESMRSGTEGDIDPADIFEGGLTVEFRDAELAIYEANVEDLADPGEIRACLVGSQPIEGVTMNDWIGPASGADLADPNNWSLGAPGASHQLRFLDSVLIDAHMSSDMAVHGLSVLGYFTSLDVDLQGHTLTLDGKDEVFVDRDSRCSGSAYGVVGFDHGEVRVPSAPKFSIDVGIHVGEDATLIAESLALDPQFGVAQLEIEGAGAHVNLAGDLIQTSSTSHSSFAVLRVLDGASLHAAGASNYGRYELRGEGSIAEFEEEILLTESFFEFNFNVHLEDGATVRSLGTTLYSDRDPEARRFTLIGEDTQWIADKHFSASEMQIHIEDGAAIRAPVLFLGGVQIHAEPSAVLDGNVYIGNGYIDSALSGRFHINGSLTGMATFRMPLDSPDTRGVNPARIIIQDAINLRGFTLEPTLAESHEPTIGDTFILLSASTIYGEFADINPPNLADAGHPELGWRIEYQPNEVLLHVVPICQGDADYDGALEARDLASLLGSLGPVDESNALFDFTMDGFVDTADLAELIGRWGSCP